MRQDLGGRREGQEHAHGFRRRFARAAFERARAVARRILPRPILPLLVALCAAILGQAGLQAAARAETLTLSHQWPTSDVRHQVAQMLADEVADAGVGLDIRIHPAASLLEPGDQYAALRAGDLDLALMPLAYASADRPAYALTVLPGLVRNHAHAARLTASPFMAEIERLLGEDGMVALVHGFLAGGLAARRACVTDPAHARGLRVRAAAGGPFADTLAAAGATIVSLPATEVYDALQTGVIDAASTSSAGFDHDRLYEQVACYVPPAERAPSIIYQPLLMSAAAGERLAPAQREALERAARAAAVLYRSEAERQDRLALEAFRGAGVAIREMLPEEFDAWRALARGAARSLAARSPDTGRLADLAFSVE